MYILASLPPVGFASSHLVQSVWLSSWMKQSLGRFFLGFLPFSSATNFITPFLHTPVIHFITSAPVLVSDLVGQHPCCSQTFNKGASLHLIPQPDPLCRTRVEDINLFLYSCHKQNASVPRTRGQHVWSYKIIFLQVAKLTCSKCFKYSHLGARTG